jgi:hypothetical protein
MKEVAWIEPFPTEPGLIAYECSSCSYVTSVLTPAGSYAPAGPPSVTIRQIKFELEKAEHGMGMPYDAERVGQLRKMLVEARKRKLSDGLARRRRDRNRRDVLNGPYDAPDRPRLRGR